MRPKAAGSAHDSARIRVVDDGPAATIVGQLFAGRGPALHWQLPSACDGGHDR